MSQINQSKQITHIFFSVCLHIFKFIFMYTYLSYEYIKQSIRFKNQLIQQYTWILKS